MRRRKCENLYLSGAQSGVWFTSCLAEEFIWVGERICIFQYMIVAAVVVIIGEFIKVGGREEFVIDAFVALFNPIQCSGTIHSMIVELSCQIYQSGATYMCQKYYCQQTTLDDKQIIWEANSLPKSFAKKARKNVAYR